MKHRIQIKRLENQLIEFSYQLSPDAIGRVVFKGKPPLSHFRWARIFLSNFKLPLLVEIPGKIEVVSTSWGFENHSRILTKLPNDERETIVKRIKKRWKKLSAKHRITKWGNDPKTFTYIVMGRRAMTVTCPIGSNVLPYFRKARKIMRAKENV